jgi:hypothetical protein
LCCILLALSIGVLAVGCGSDEKESQNNGMHHQHDAGGDTTHELDESQAKATHGGDFFISYTPSPDPVPFNELFELQVDVYESDAMQSRVDGADVTVDVTMPAHGHGMTTDPTVTANTDGGYLVEGMKFHMESNTPMERWEIEVAVDSDGTSDMATFEVMCCGE